MTNMDISDKQKFIFGRLFLLPNKLQVIGDRLLAGDGITIRQWLLTAVIVQLGETPPTLSRVAEIMGSSHQNVKQLALKLQEKGFLNMERDGKDQRATHLVLTEKSFSFWIRRQPEIKKFLTEIFADLREDEIELLNQSLKKLFEVILKTEKYYKKL